MAQSTTLLLLPQSVYSAGSVTGQKQPAAGYYLGNKNLQTITWTLNSFQGTIIIEASLETEPSNDDWFIIYTLATGGSTLTQTSFTNLEGNFVWIRAKVNPFYAGTVQNVKVTY